MIGTPSMTATSRKGKLVLLVEDEPDIAEVIRLTLERDGFQTEWCPTGEQALERIRSERDDVDLVMLDIILPGIDGHEVCRRIRSDEKLEDLPVIMLTSLTEETDMVVGLGMGADDYVRKPFSGPELVARTRAALRRQRRPEPNSEGRIITIGPLEIDPDRHGVRVDGKNVHLTLAEYRLLYFLACNPGRAFTRQDLLPHVVGEGVYVIDRNIDVHVRNVRKKVGPCSRYIVTVRGIGYRFEAEAG